jgi:hypothetical protein
VLKKRREVIFIRYSSLLSNSIKTVTIFIRNIVGVILELGLRRILYLLLVSKDKLLVNEREKKKRS